MDISEFLALTPEQRKELKTIELTADHLISLEELQALFKALHPCIKLERIEFASGALSHFSKEILGNAFIQAVTVGNVALGTALLDSNSTLIDYTLPTASYGQQSALTMATLLGRSIFVELLLNRGATYGDKLDIYFMNMVKMGQVGMAKLLLDKGAKVDFIYKGKCVLEILVEEPQKMPNHILMLQLLCEYGAGLSKTFTPALVEKICEAFKEINFNVDKEFDKVKFLYPYNKILIFTTAELEKSLRSDNRLPQLLNLSSNHNKIDFIPEVLGVINRVDEELKAARPKFRH